MTKSQEAGLDYIYSLLYNDDNNDNDNVEINIITKDNKVVLKQNNMITGTIRKEEHDNYGEILELINALKDNNYDKD